MKLFFLLSSSIFYQVLQNLLNDKRSNITGSNFLDLFLKPLYFILLDIKSWQTNFTLRIEKREKLGRILHSRPSNSLELQSRTTESLIILDFGTHWHWNWIFSGSQSSLVMGSTRLFIGAGIETWRVLLTMPCHVHAPVTAVKQQCQPKTSTIDNTAKARGGQLCSMREDWSRPIEARWRLHTKLRRAWIFMKCFDIPLRSPCTLFCTVCSDEWMRVRCTTLRSYNFAPWIRAVGVLILFWLNYFRLSCSLRSTFPYIYFR